MLLVGCDLYATAVARNLCCMLAIIFSLRLLQTHVVQDALQTSSRVNVSEPGSALPETKDGISGCQAAAGIENFAPEHTKDFCITQLREIIFSLSGEKAELMGQLSKSQEKATAAEGRLQHVTSECSKWSDEVRSRLFSHAMLDTTITQVLLCVLLSSRAICFPAFSSMHSDPRKHSL